jgi:hypothetical protein
MPVCAVRGGFKSRFNRKERKNGYKKGKSIT